MWRSCLSVHLHVRPSFLTLLDDFRLKLSHELILACIDRIYAVHKIQIEFYTYRIWGKKKEKISHTKHCEMRRNTELIKICDFFLNIIQQAVVKT
jgi:hypothetical protein